MYLPWPGFNEQGTVIIGLASDAFGPLKNSIDVDGVDYRVKDELHITLIGSQAGLMLRHKIDQHAALEALLVSSFVASDWSYRPGSAVHLLSRSRQGQLQKTIIMLLLMPAIAGFYARLKQLALMETSVALPPAHVTLYTHNCDTGIGVASAQALAELTTKTLPSKAFLERARLAG